MAESRAFLGRLQQDFPVAELVHADQIFSTATGATNPLTDDSVFG